MVTRSMPFFLITFNLSDLQYFFRLLVAGIASLATEYTTLAFWYATATMNLVVVAKFFYETCTNIFDYLLIAGLTHGGLFSLVSIFFGMVETNSWGMLHLHCLVWLKGMSNLVIFC